ncbi:hypothetical protein [Priestia megaterium]
MCEKCNGSGRFYTCTSAIPGLLEVQGCSCNQHMRTTLPLDQQLEILDAKIEAFERGLQNANAL